MKVRDAILSDAMDIAELLSGFHTESRYGQSELEFCKDTMLRTVIGFLENVPETFCKVVVSGSKLTGLLLADYAPIPFAKGVFSRVAFFYIAPAYRGGMSAFRMLKQYVQWAKELGAREIHGGTSSGVSPRRTVGLYEKLGFEEAGHTMRFVQ
jgi:GNAT superfamily N-acetyltransferase